MLSLEDVSDTELAAFASDLDLRHAARRAFLASTKPCHVQAAPGAGKTTLLGVKLELLARRWRNDQGAIAVLSHTNVARQEIERRLHGKSSAMFLRYPHSVGTLTQFVHTYIALPTARGLGLPVQSIDAERFRAAAIAELMRATRAHGWLANQVPQGMPASTPYLSKVRIGAERVAQQLLVDSDEPLRLRLLGGLSDRASATFRGLQQTRSNLSARGLFEFGDMLAIARFGLSNMPLLTRALAQRFPLIILDEAQDTSEEALRILGQLADAGSVLQCIGDVNQAILSDNKVSAWQPGPDAIDLDETMRFGAKIAAATSSLTVHRPQIIRPGSGAAASADQLYLLVYGEGRAAQVAPRFAALVVEHIGADCNAWAVAHRRNANAQSQTQQTTLLSYFPELSGAAPSSEEPNLCRVLQRWSTGLESFSAIDRTLHALLQGQPLAEQVLSDLSTRQCLRSLGQQLPNAAHCLRSWIATVDESAFADEAAWESAVGRLARDLAPEWAFDQTSETSRSILSFAGQSTEGSRAAKQEQVVYSIGAAALALKVGTVARIKGQTHDATLYLATTLNRMRTGDKLVKAIATKAPVNWGPQEKMMLANMFVALSRPRHIAACAVPVGDVNDCDKVVFAGRGWKVIEV